MQTSLWRYPSWNAVLWLHFIYERQCGPPIRIGVVKEKALFQPQKIGTYVCMSVFSVKIKCLKQHISFFILPLNWLFNFLFVPFSPATGASNELKVNLKFSCPWNGTQCKDRVKIKKKKSEVTKLFSSTTNKNAAKASLSKYS